MKNIPRTYRVIHWVIAGVVVLNAFILESGDPPHRYLGYFAVALVVSRLLLAFFLKYNSGFHFSLSELKSFSLSLIRMSPKDYSPDRNPVASYVYVFIWLCVIGLGVSGWLMGLDAFWGNDALEDVHELISNLLLLLVGAHFVGMLTDAYFHKRKPWKDMLKTRLVSKDD